MATTVEARSWEVFLREAREYHKAAEGGRRNRPEIFTNEIVFNMLGMVIEKYFMAFLMKHGEMADNHTFSDLAVSAERVKPLPPDLVRTLQSLDEVQNLCPVYDQVLPTDYSDGVIARISAVADAVCEYSGFSAPGQALNYGLFRVSMQR